MGRKLNVRPFLSPNKSSIDVIILSTTTEAISTRASALTRTGHLLEKRTKTVYPKRWFWRLDSTTLLFGVTVPPIYQPLDTSTTLLLLAANLPSSLKPAMP